MRNSRLLLMLLGLGVLLGSCVNPRLLQDEKKKNAQLTEESKKCTEKLAQELEKNDELMKRVAELESQVKFLRNDTTTCEEGYRRLKEKNDNLNELYEKVIQQNKELLSMSTGEREKLSLELESKKRELEKKEKELAEKQVSIAELTKGLEEREKRVKELENILASKEAAVNQLKTKLTDALIGFSEDELSVEIKNGKVYVSLSEQLLFKSGSITVDPKGAGALTKLAQVLEKNTDVNIVIEGHTDNVPYRSGGSGAIKDNWDLSVLRATSIVRILSDKNRVDPKRVTCAGRGEYMPVASNDAETGRSKNRRTEIILTPKLDEILKILENN